MPDALVEADDEIAQVLADATSGARGAAEVRTWLAAQRQALSDALAGLVDA